MPLIKKLKAAFEDAGDPVGCQCLNCGSTFLSALGPSEATCPECRSSRLRETRRR